MSMCPRFMAAVQMALERGLLPDDETLKQLTEEADSLVAGRDPASLRWPAEPLRMVLIRRAVSPNC